MQFVACGARKTGKIKGKLILVQLWLSFPWPAPLYRFCNLLIYIELFWFCKFILPAFPITMLRRSVTGALKRGAQKPKVEEIIEDKEAEEDEDLDDEDDDEEEEGIEIRNYF